MLTARKSDERGVALILTLFLALVVAGMAIGVILMASNSNLIAKFHSTEAMMAAAADAGLEQGRDTLNGTPTLIPVGQGFDTLELNAPVRDANNVVIPGFTRSLYAGENGDTTGQFGVFASVISVISNVRGAVVVRRMQLKQDSFSRFARFFNTWACCAWGNTEVVFGPVHSNQGMAVQTRGGFPGATFWGPVTTVGNVTNQAHGNWNGGIQTGAPPIAFPTTQTLNNLQAFATTGQTVVTGYGTLNAADPDTRVEFVALDMNGDGDTQDQNEGFYRVFKAWPGGSATVQSQRRSYVSARRWQWGDLGTTTYPAGTTAASDPNIYSPNCGGTYAGDWWTADSVYVRRLGTVAQNVAAVRAALASGTRRCYLGGDRRLYPDSLNRIADLNGYWVPWAGWAGAPPAALIAAVQPMTVAGQETAVASTFIPITRAMNPNFKGIIFVNGSVAISGTIRGRVTVVTTGDVTLADDLIYVQPPGTNCADILGVLTQMDALIENNNINTPFRNNNVWTVQFDDTPDEIFHGFFLTLGLMEGESFAGDPAVTAPENCGGKSRGCKSIIGGTIQQGIAATFTGNSGWAEQDTYDGCGVTAPPPYYPTTGRFTKNRYYEIDPVGFDVATWFVNNQ